MASKTAAKIKKKTFQFQPNSIIFHPFLTLSGVEDEHATNEPTGYPWVIKMIQYGIQEGCHL